MNTQQKMASAGGKARAAALTPEQRSEIASRGAVAANAKRASKRKARETIRWRQDGLCLLGMTIVGNVEKASSGCDFWYAYACDVDWQDVSLGNHPTESKARHAVVYWVRERL